MTRDLLLATTAGGWATTAVLSIRALIRVRTHRIDPGYYSHRFTPLFATAATLYTVQNVLLIWDGWWRQLPAGPLAFTLLSRAAQVPLMWVALASAVLVIRHTGTTSGGRGGQP